MIKEAIIKWAYRLLVAAFWAVLVCQADSVLAQSRALSFAVQISTDVPQVVLAQERGYWKEAGIDVKLIPFSSGREAFEALLGGKIDMAVMTEFPATIGVVRNQKFTIIADLSRYRAQRVIASGKKMSLSSLRELDGRRVGTTLGTNGEYLTSVLLKEGGANAQVVNVSPPDQVAALVRGDIDASVMFPNFYAQAKKMLGADYREIVTSSYISHGLIVVSPETLASRSADLTAFIKGLVRADGLIRAEPAAGQEAIVRALKGIMSADVLAELWKDYEYKLILNEDLVTLMQKEAAWIIERGMMVKAPASASERKNVRSFIDSEPLQSVAKENVTLQP